ncbi:hypothetical protein GGQ18_002931 [Salinibacter ruber]|nr:hypothetical protein [Salinibacter ruber]
MKPFPNASQQDDPLTERSSKKLNSFFWERLKVMTLFILITTHIKPSNL